MNDVNKHMPDEKSDFESMPDSENPFVSVIIPVFNDAENLRKCLYSLQQQTYPADRVEIIVVDNGSDRKLNDVTAGFERTILLEESMPGSYAARNKGISKATGEVWAFIDSDIVAEQDWLQKGIDMLYSQPGIGAVGGKVDFSFQNAQNPTPVELFDSLTSFRQKDYIEKTNFSGTGNLFSLPAIFEKVGLFNKDLKSGGDREWGNRVHNAGYSIVYAQEAVVYHPARNNLKEVLKKHRRVGGGIGQQLRGPQRVQWKKLFKAQVVEVLIFLRLSWEIFFGRGIPLLKKMQMLLINIAVSSLRIYEVHKVLMGGSPIR